MHISNRVINMEIIFNIHSIYEFPWIDIHQNSGQYCAWLNNWPFLASFKCSDICKPRNCFPYLRNFLNIHMHVHIDYGLIQIERSELRLGCSKILRIIHTIVNLVLVSIEITYGPFNFISHRFSLLIELLLLHFSCHIHALGVCFKISQRIAHIKYFR